MLVGTTVLGDIRVAQDAGLLLDGAVVGGEIRVVRNGYLDAFGGTSVAGDVEGRNAYGIFFDNATIGGSVYQSRPNPTDQEPFLYLFSTGVAGGLDSSAGEVLLESSQVQGDVFARSGEYADIVDSVLGGGSWSRTTPSAASSARARSTATRCSAGTWAPCRSAAAGS